LQERLTALTAFVVPVRSCRFRLGVMEKLRSAAIGQEPGEPGRQVEQQHEPFSRREPQQQPDEPQQQHRVPHCPQLRPEGMEFPVMTMSMGLNRLPSRSRPLAGCDKMTKRSPGAGSSVDAGSKAPGGWIACLVASLGVTLPIQAAVTSMILAGGETALPSDAPSGRPDGNGEFAFVGALEISGGYRGSVVALFPTWVLTAGHNVELNDDGAPDAGWSGIVHLPGYGSYAVAEAST
jgi:hypothetical protein